jgi:hypothetical protein
MKHQTLFKLMVVLALMVALSSTGSRVHAATAAIGQFYAGCGSFSVDVAVFGNKDDGNGQDRFWYSVTDATGKKLYNEFAWRGVNEAAGSLVVDLSYDADGVADGAPTQNPIKISAIELDSNNTLGAELASATYDAPCLAASHTADHAGIFWPPQRMFGTITATTPFFLAPNSGPLSVYALPGAQHQVIYRTPDATWVAIFLSSNDLLWIPAGTINVDLSQLAVPPTHIDRSSLDAATTGITAPASAPTGITGRVTIDGLRLRSAPDYVSPTITSLPLGAEVAVLGRNAARTFVKVNYNGTVGWLSAYYVRLSAGWVGALPVIQ